jgi:hypothetical protein
MSEAKGPYKIGRPEEYEGEGGYVSERLIGPGLGRWGAPEISDPMTDEEQTSLVATANAIYSAGRCVPRRAEEGNGRLILGRTAKKLGSTVEHIGKLWDKRGEMARHFGTALHVAMETWFLGRGTGYEIPKIQFLADAVDSFPLKNEKVLPEIMVSDVKRLLVGQIDGLLVTGEKQGVILDYKTDQSIKKNLPKHEAQMSLYASILKAFGWSISHAELWSYTSKWEKFHVDLKEVKI